ncbi:hypothetical protein BASA50_010969 [Batrachochytrium salamandrivorans]|uniref:Uncharacterized protein n=1 Tax=Batrachochytrium salamandrivorans TaxID=1357716 RepID=A0ABQ8EWX5_9FUNG|nr:hypothetical protein BASA50_010969 [Batrachochytrium salamandrivorans]
MRLISFAVISLLAITVSAQSPPSTSTANDAPKCDKDAIKKKIQDLRAAYAAQDELITKLREPGKVEQEGQAIMSVMKEIEEELKKKDLPEGEKPSLEKHYDESVDDLEKHGSAQIPKHEQLKEARNQRYRICGKNRTY